MAQMSLAGEVAVITGGGRGIGRVIAEHMAGEGAKVLLFGRAESSLADAAEAISANGGKAAIYAGDVSEKADVLGALEHAEKDLGPVTIVVNNAGIGSGGPIWESDHEEWWNVFEVNLKGPFLFTWAATKAMVKRGRGCIINMGSYQGIFPNGSASSYSTSKAALTRLTDCTSESLEGTGVTAFCISPGFVWTDMTRKLDERQKENDPNYEPMPEEWVFPAEDCADLCIRLARGDADALSGRMIHVRDDLDAMIARAKEIIEKDEYALRLTIDVEA